MYVSVCTYVHILACVVCECVRLHKGFIGMPHLSKHVYAIFCAVGMLVGMSYLLLSLSICTHV